MEVASKLIYISYKTFSISSW